MKKISIALLLSFFVALNTWAQSGKSDNMPDPSTMKVYYMAILKSGPERSQDSVQRAQIMAGHMAHIMQMASDKKLVLAGPFMDNSELRGIFIFNVAEESEARALTNEDPAIKAGRLIAEIHPWYGPVLLQEIDWAK